MLYFFILLAGINNVIDTHVNGPIIKNSTQMMQCFPFDFQLKSTFRIIKMHNKIITIRLLCLQKGITTT